MKIKNGMAAVVRHRCNDGKFTYRDLLVILTSLTDTELTQEVMALPHGCDESAPVYLLPLIACDTIRGFEATRTHSAADFKHHPEQIVLLADLHPFSKDGDSCYELLPDGKLLGNNTGKVFETYPKENES